MLENFRYTFRIKWTSLLGALSFGIVVPTFFIPLQLGSQDHLVSIAVATVTSYIIWEGSKLIQALTLYLLPWEVSIGKHLAYEVGGVFVFSSVMLIAGIFIYDALVSSLRITVGVVLQNIIVSFLLALLFIAINEGAFLFDKWKESLVEQEKLRQENLIAKVEGLTKQLDPHFLFNSLSVLSGVVYKDPELADTYITNLAQVYRYVLEHNHERQVPLHREIQVVQAYCFLLNVRFYNKISLDIQPCDDSFRVLPMSVQLLVENAVKHNYISAQQPLGLRIYCTHDMLWVENSLNKKAATEKHTGIGLRNLQARYQYVTGKSIVVENNRLLFRVGLPRISEKN